MSAWEFRTDRTPRASFFYAFHLTKGGIYVANNDKSQGWMTEEGLSKVRELVGMGLTDAELAKQLGCSRCTIYAWRKRFPEFAEAMDSAKAIPNEQVEASLFKNTQGYFVEEEYHERKFNDSTGEFELVLARKTKKYIPPNITAIIFWLKNRMPERWRDRQEVELSGEVANPFNGLSEEQLRKLAQDG